MLNRLFVLVTFLFVVAALSQCNSPIQTSEVEKELTSSESKSESNPKEPESLDASSHENDGREPEIEQEVTPETHPIPKVSLPISQRLCVAHPEVHGPDALVKSQLKWMAQQLKAAGVSYLRYQLFWHRIETKKGEFDFSRYDRAVTILGEAGIKLVGVLGYGNPWASSKTKDDPYFPPDDLNDFANYVTKTVEHYKGSIDRWEIWNEPNAGYRFWKSEPHGDPVAYSKLLVKAIKAVKQVDPKSHVAFGGPFYIELVIMGAIPFLEKSFKAEPELAQLLDRLTVHPYPNYPPAYEPEDGSTEEKVPLPTMLAQTSRFLPGKPLWITEVGWPDYYKVDRTIQSEFLTRSFLLSFAGGAELVCWYKFADSKGKTLFPAEHLFGLFEEGGDWSKKPPKSKPAYDALKTIHKLLGKATEVTDVRQTMNLKPGEYGLQFKAPTETIYAFWRTKNTQARSLPVPVKSGTQTKSYTHLGKELETKRTEDEIIIPLTTGPIFVVASN